jgi:uncharacterized membrane protein YjgN (DUF898 family)
MTVADAPAAPTGPAVPAAPATAFVGDGRSYWRLLIRGAVLLAVTLGIYRFWFATDMRRFLWANTEIAGDTLEYAGTALELLMGFLIAIALLVPLNVVFFVAALNLGTIGGLTGVLAFPLLAFLGHFAVYRARRYRLTRTLFRGVRCHQTGSAWRYAVCALFWWTLIVLTLGLAYPFAQANLERFKMRNTYYGDLRASFAGSGFRLMLRGLPMWLLVAGPLVYALIYAARSVDWNKAFEAAAAGSASGDMLSQIEGAAPGIYAAVVVVVAAVGVSVTMAAILFPVFQAMMLRWWMSGVRFGPLTVRSRLRTGQIYGAYLRFLLYGFLFSLAAVVVAGVAVLGYSVGPAALRAPDLTEIAGAVAAVGFYVVVMLGFSTIYQGTVKLALWRSAVETAEIEGAAVLDGVKAAGVPSSAVGEGLADALNVGGI